MAAAPHFFERTAVCLDLSALDREPGVAELRAVIDAVRRAGMLAIGLTAGANGVEELARAIDFPVMSQFRAQHGPAPVVQAVESPPSAQPTLLHQQPGPVGAAASMRRQRDLIATATVGAGAELMADGCVHIYGSMRGRVMAGVRGDVSARVFCQEFNPELVSIAGVFRVFETLPPTWRASPCRRGWPGTIFKFARLSGSCSSLSVAFCRWRRRQACAGTGSRARMRVPPEIATIG